MKLFKRIITSLLIIVTCVSLCFTTVFAAWYNDAAYLYSTCGIGQWVADAVLTGGGGALGGYLGGLAGTVTLPGIGTVNGAAVGKAIGVAAGHTGKEALDAFMNYLAQDSSFVSEEDYVSTLDNSVITSSDTAVTLSFNDLPIGSDDYPGVGTVLTGGHYLVIPGGSSDLGHMYAQFVAGSTGMYTITYSYKSSRAYVDRSKLYFQVLTAKGWEYLTSFTNFSNAPHSLTFSFIAGNTYRFYFSVCHSVPDSAYNDFVQLIPSVVISSDRVIAPDSSTRVSSFTQTINNYNTTNNTTNYYIGTTDATGKVNQVYDSNLFDEQKMVFTEPVSGVQYQCVGWKYYYDDRAYILELADNSLSYNGTDIKYLVLQYGDDAVHILGYSSATTLDNLDFVFSDDYAYVIATATNTNPEACQHVYTSETVTAPTCTEQGVRRYTCELCGYTRDEKIPATGHAWEATEIVETELNENGDVTKLGYTVYTCSSCGETYKQYDNTGQPGPPGSDDPGTGSASGSGFWDRIKNAVETALASLIESVLTLITTVLTSLLSLVMDLLSFFFSFLSDTVISGIGGFFSSFTDGSLFEFFKSDNGTGYELPEGVAGVFAFFSGIFLCLPADLRFVLIFGIGLTFFLAVFKLVHS